MANTNFDQIRLDAMREITSIGAGNAATSLSAILAKSVDVTVPNIEVEALEKIPQMLGGQEKTVAAVYFLVRGQVSGTILLVLTPSESLKIANLLTGQEVAQIKDLDELGKSALREVGNGGKTDIIRS